MQRALNISTEIVQGWKAIWQSSQSGTVLFTKKGEVDRTCSSGWGNMFCQGGEVCGGFPAYQIGLKEAQLIKLTIPCGHIGPFWNLESQTRDYALALFRCSKACVYVCNDCVVANSLYGYSQGWTWPHAETDVCVLAPTAALEVLLGLRLRPGPQLTGSGI
jgi:hypothetical protein